MFDLQYWAQTPAGQDLIEMGMEKGIERGMERGLQQGRLLQAKHTIRKLIDTRYSELSPILAIDEIQNADQAEHMLDRLLSARTADEVRAILESRQ